MLDGPDLPSNSLIEPLGLLVADFLEETLTDGQLLGLSWGRTLAAAAKAISKLAKVDVVQAAGSLARLDFVARSTELVHRFAAPPAALPIRFSGRCGWKTPSWWAS